jgi:hypothetical protein
VLLKSIALIWVAATVAASTSTTHADLKVTHRALVPLCVNSAPANHARQWTVESGPMTLALTMKNQPRPGIGNEPAGVAVISFLPEPGHVYEVEVRADAMAFSRRVYPKGEWTPVVRDRTINRIVSGEPEWIGGQCGE